MTPLLPWRPASLSPSEILRFWATYTRTSWLTPGGSSWESSRENTRTSITFPDSPWGTLSEVSLTSRAFSPKIARKQPLFWGLLGLTFGGDLPYENVACVDLGTDADDPALVEVGEDLL